MIYLDSSALLRFLLQHSNFINLVEYKNEFVSSELLRLECQRALIRYRLNQELRDEGLLQLTEQLNDLLSRISLLKVNSEILESASQNWGVNLGSLDSIHLASALFIKKEKKSAIQIFTHDKALYTAARLSNLEVTGVVV
jgi:predicted nucleic acid-binding protein